MFYHDDDIQKGRDHHDEKDIQPEKENNSYR